LVYKSWVLNWRALPSMYCYLLLMVHLSSQ
jgi:hypothetical protein